MNGAQDLGGMMGFGAIDPEPGEPLFHAPWERRCFALTLAAGATGAWTIDAMRFSRESLPPAEYLASSYYEIWLKALSAKLIEKKLVTPAELASGAVESKGASVPRVLSVADVAPVFAAGTCYARPRTTTPPFRLGDRVRTKVMNPAHHTRLPRYARGKSGVVERVHGVFVFPDTCAHELGENAQWLFTVTFTGDELWGEDAEPCLTVSIDAWETYFEAATSSQ